MGKRVEAREERNKIIYENLRNNMKEERLLVKFGLEDPLNVPTDGGRDLLLEILYKEHRSKIIEVAKVLEEEEKKEEKKYV